MPPISSTIKILSELWINSRKLFLFLWINLYFKLNRSQEVHLKHLKQVRNEIDKMKFGSSPSNGLLKNGSMTGIRFNVVEKNEIRKMIMLKNHLNNRNFNLQERMMTVYT